MRILLTGASGMVGRNIAEAMQDDAELLMPSHKELDLLDEKAVRSYLHEKQPDMVIHVAGLVGGIAVNSRNPLRFLVENMDMGRNVIYGSFRMGIPRLLNLGSSCMYPRGHEDPLTEDMVLKGELEPTNEGYALAKVMCARMCSYIGREHPEFRYKTLIPCNLYGRYDKFTGENSHMVPAVIHKLYQARLHGQENIAIWGSGMARREFMYAGDLADCIRYAVRNFEMLPEMMNVGLGHDYTVNEYYAAIADIVGFEGTFSHDLSRPEGMKRKLVDVTRMREFGWVPKHDLRQGLAKTVEFYRSQVLGER